MGRDGALGEDFVDVGEVHFEAMLVLVDVLRHVLEQSGLVKLGCGFGVHGEVSEGCAVVRAFCQSGVFKVELV